MPVIRALAFLWVRSARNRIWARLRRFRQPKYLVGGVVGLLYFWFFLFRNMFGGHFGPRGELGSPGAAPEFLAAFEVAGAWGLLLMIAGFWIVPSRRAALDFSEAEVQFLFPAPVSRRGLLHYKLASWQAGLLFTSLMVSLFSGRLLRGDGAWMAVIGWWMGLLLLQLHSLGASFVRTWLLNRGIAHWQRRLVVALTLTGSLAGALAWGWREAPASPGDFSDLESFAAWWVAVSQTTPIRQLLTPTRWVTQMAMTRDMQEFLGLAGPVVGLVVIHYVWVIRATVAFEEASVDAARAAMIAAARVRSGRSAGSPLPRGGRAPLMIPLKPIGASWLALGWKNLAAAGEWFRGVTGWVMVLIAAVLFGVGAVVGRGSAWAATVGAVATMLWLMSVLVGPSNARMDLRHELAGTGWELLKALPLPGWQVVLGELLAPWCVLTALQWGLGAIAVAYLPAPSDLGEVGLFERGLAFWAMALIGPSISILSLCLHNGAALLFPAWVLVSPGQARGGFEVLGQRMIVFVGQMLGLLVALIPAAVAGTLVLVAAGWLMGSWIGFGAAAATVSGVLLVESAFAVRCLGWIWDRADLSRERVG